MNIRGPDTLVGCVVEMLYRNASVGACFALRAKTETK